MLLKNSTRQIEMPDHTALIQEHREVLQYNPETTVTIQVQTSTHRITPDIHREVIPEEVVQDHMAEVLPPVPAVAAAVTEDGLNVQIPDIENKFVESIF